MFSVKKIILFFAIILFYTVNFGKTNVNVQPNSNNNAKQNEMPKENLITKRLNNYTNICNPEPGLSFEGDYFISSPNFSTDDVFMSSKIKFKSDPRTDENIPFAFHFCPPKNLSKYNATCDDGFGYFLNR
jgi:hypothetical protein